MNRPGVKVVADTPDSNGTDLSPARRRLRVEIVNVPTNSENGITNAITAKTRRAAH